jgi:hypothetical protein
VLFRTLRWGVVRAEMFSLRDFSLKPIISLIFPRQILSNHAWVTRSAQTNGGKSALPETPLYIWETEQPLLHLLIRRFRDGLSLSY